MISRESTRRTTEGGALPILVGIQVVIAVVAIAITVAVGVKIKPLIAEKQQLEADIATSRAEVGRLEAQLQETRRRLEETLELSRYVHPVDLVDIKMVASRYPRPAELLQLILDMRAENVGWQLGGRTPSEGFDSPSFAAFVLRELGVAPAPRGEVEGTTSRYLLDRLEPSTGPAVGSLVFYPGGYVMFYFRDQRNAPFVIGMTPAGIAALEPTFAKPTAYRKSGLEG